MDKKNTEIIEEAPEVIDETELDKELEESIAKVNAGNELAQKEEVKPEETPETPETPEETEETPETPETPEETEAPKEEEPSNPPEDEAKPGEYVYRIPNKGKFESDESFEKRTELMDLVQKRKLAKTKEQRQQISDEIITAKGQLKTLNGSDKFINPPQEKGDIKTEEPKEVDEVLEADKERFKELGGTTKEEVQEILRQERFASEVKGTLDNFIDRHAELKDEDVREVFFDFVESNYAWQDKSGKDLMTVLELAKESMFKPDESITERVIKGANVQEKVNSMQFPGGTVTKPAYTPDMQASIDELTATGMSEEKALELLSEDE